ncbi:MAG: DUF6776 family protein [Luminiphilus sp.]
MKKHQERTMVVRVHPHAWRWRAGAAAGALAVTLLVGYLWGASSDSEMPFFDSPEEKLRDQVTQLSVERDTDQQTLRDLRASLADQAAELNEMRDMLALYRGVMVPDGSEEVVVLRPPTVEYDVINHSLRLVSLVHRGTGDDETYQGHLTVLVEGLLDEQNHIVNLAALDTGQESSVFPLRFRYLQKVQVAVSLPKGFVPESVVSSLRLDEPRVLTRERRDALSDTVATAMAER